MTSVYQVSRGLDIGAPVADEQARLLWAYAASVGAGRDDAGDFVQEAMVRLTVAVAEGKQIRDERAWLFAAVHRLIIDDARRRNRLGRALARLAGLRESRVAGESPDRQNDDVWRVVDTLPARQRAAVYFRYRADLDFRAIGEVMGISESAARSYVTKALDKLEAELDEWRQSR